MANQGHTKKFFAERIQLITAFAIGLEVHFLTGRRILKRPGFSWKPSHYSIQENKLPEDRQVEV